MSPANTPDLKGHISELYEMHEVAESKLIKLAQPTVLLSRIDELKLLEIDDAKTNPPENHQDNGATPPVITKLSLLHSPLENALVSPSMTPPRTLVKARNADLQAQERDHPDIHLLGADYMIYGVYQD